MKKIRCYLAAIALLATLSGLPLQGLGSGLMANAASSRHASSVSSPFVVGKLTRPEALRLHPPCGGGGTNDC